MTRITFSSTIIFYWFFCGCCLLFFQSFGQLNLGFFHDEIPSGYFYRNISNSTVSECLQHCLQDCYCSSFQLCGQQCQLSPTIRSQIPKQDIRNNSVCTNFVLEDQKNINVYPEGCQKSCSVKFNCCQTCTYCFNNGTCVLSSLPGNSQRSTCHCLPGFVGERCETRAMSCRSYISKDSGLYTIFDKNNQSYSVFCLFGGNSAWTLVMSYKLALKHHHRRPYFKDHPRNESSFSWDDFRLSWSRMDGIKEHGNPNWALTCNYDKEGFKLDDYLFTSHIQTPILYQNKSMYHGACHQVVLYAIRGRWCIFCGVSIWQDLNSIFHIDSYKSMQMCNNHIPGYNCSVSQGEDTFGHYSCINEGHRCAKSSEATTQLWFVGSG